MNRRDGVRSIQKRESPGYDDDEKYMRICGVLFDYFIYKH